MAPKKKGNSGGASPASVLSPSSSNASLNATTEEATSTPPVAISIGTSYCCVAYYKDGRSQVMANEDGERVTPCCVAFTDQEMFAGTAAKNQIVRNRQNTIVEFTKLLGKKFDEIGEDSKEWFHKVVEKDGKPFFEVDYKGQMTLFSPEDITAIMLKRMKETAEAYLGLPVKEVGLSIPIGVSEAYQKALLEAATQAGLTVYALVKEPIASLLSYGIGQAPDEFAVDRSIVVFDLGGHYLDVTLVSSYGGLFEIRAHTKERLGGKDYDQKLVEHFAKEFKRKEKLDIDDNPKALSKLRYASEGTKRTLSNSPAAHISVESLHEGVDFHGSINRSMFDMITGPLTRRCLATAQTVLDEIQIEPSEVDEVILIGGGTAIQSVQAFVEAFFEGVKVRKTVAPDESIACGIAYEASILSKERDHLHYLFETKAVPSTIGVADFEGKMSPIIRRGCPVPVKRKVALSTSQDNQTSFIVSLFAGENRVAKENVPIGDLVITGLTARPKGEIHVDVAITVEEDGHLKAVALEKASLKQVHLSIMPPK